MPSAFQLDATLVSRAQRGRRQAIHQVVQALYPTITRLALALAGRADVARGIVAFVLRQGIRRHERWTDPDAPSRWFYHHTVLTARRSARHESTPQQETLTPDTTNNAYVAFVRTLRLLPQQQREAVILTYGEALPERMVAIAMDCSTSAAATHLKAARAALSPMTGDKAALDAMLSTLHQNCQRLTPDADSIFPGVSTAVGRALLPRRLVRLAKLLVAAAVAVMAFWAWRKYFA